MRDGIGRFSGPPHSLSKIAAQSARDAMRDAGWDGLRDDDGLILATTTGKIRSWEKSFIDATKKNEFQSFLATGGIRTPGESLEELKGELNFSGRSLLVSSACSAATQALALAALWVSLGRVKRCLVGGAEVLTILSFEGFKSLGLLAKQDARPFDKDRQGINLSEAVAFFCVEASTALLGSPDGAARTKAKILGFGMSADAYHLTSPQPDGRGSVAAISSALAMAKLQPQDIGWIHAHGTGSLASDRAENAAIYSIFKDGVPVSSTKGYHGHALGASGALEAAICILALQKQTRLGSLGFLCGEDTLKIKVQTEHESASLKYIVKNSLGFGGVNAALVLARADIESVAKSHAPSPVSFALQIAGHAESSQAEADTVNALPDFRRATFPMAAAVVAVKKLQTSLKLIMGDRIGLVFGSSRGEIYATCEFLRELALHNTARPFLFQVSSHNSTPGFLAQHFGLRGPCVSLSHGFQTGESVLEVANLLLSAHLCDAVIAVAGDFGGAPWMDARFKDGGTAIVLTRPFEPGFANLGQITEFSFGEAGDSATNVAAYESDFLARLVDAVANKQAAEKIYRPDGTLSRFKMEIP